MERKIGEVFEHNGDWYQCIEADNDDCIECDLAELCPCKEIAQNIGLCSAERRNDSKSVIFKKLEKVGEPYKFDGHLFQSYRTFEVPIFTENYATVRELGNNSKISIEIKQNKEDMEENKITFPKEDNALTRTVYAYVNGKISDKELIRSIKEMSDEYPYNKNSLKPFSLELAKQGKPVCTRDGRKARIICFDAKGDKPIIALVEMGTDEIPNNYPIDGKAISAKETYYDLMMLPEKKEGWVNVYKDGLLGTRAYNTKKEAFDNASPCDYIDTVRISWEE